MKILISVTLVFAFLILANAQSINGNDSPKAAFVVNDNGDTTDATAGNGVCADANGNCTLRAAIEEANALGDADTITFALAAPSTISLTLRRLIISSDVSIIGLGARNLTVQRSVAAGTPNFRVFTVVRLNVATTDTVVSLSGITIANGRDTIFGGISNGSNCTLNLTEVAVKNNVAADVPGGGIINFGLLSISRSRISNNTASQSGGISNQSAGTVRIENTTISGNVALGVPAQSISGAGGAINNFNQATLNNVTVTNNTSANFSAGITTTSVINVRNSIIAGNNSPTWRDVSGNFNSLGNNLIGDNSGALSSFPAGNPNTNGDKVGAFGALLDPLLAPLQNNGGQTDSHALLPGSPAIDFGNNCVVDGACPSNNPVATLQTDQRGNGFFRRIGTNVDSGAFEAGNIVALNRRAFDFDGDGKSDLSVFRPSNGVWYLNQSQSGFTGISFGQNGDRIVPADYDGDGKTDVAVFRNGTWYLQRSTQGFAGIAFGEANDKPIPNAFVP